PISEVNEFSYKSKNNKVSHKCGHDGHTTILLGLAKLISKFPLKDSAVYLLWQPAEETGEGAKSVLNDPFFKDLKINHVFALHNLPRYNESNIIIKSGNFTPEVKSIIIKLEGKTSHAAEIENGINPAIAIAELIKFFASITNNSPDSKDFYLATPIYSNLGSRSYGISAGNGELHYTLRAWDPELFNNNSKLIDSKLKEIYSKYKIKSSINWTGEFSANINSPSAVDHIRDAAIDLELNIIEQKSPMKWGEDFGLFTQKYKGAMFGVGNGINSAALHNPDYDFNDKIIGTSISIFYSIIEEISNN
ncbi:M20/M25/M40 family metallo-hydrolase, partial [Candidatus Kapabacteria bacterium]|nr:M20/M25/M40 family metallo-hydrolase [Candidatus Kapabacteria bacterium]